VTRPEPAADRLPSSSRSAVCWTTANPNSDPLCRGSVRVSANGRTITVPVAGKCPSCDSAHIAPSTIPVTWSFVST
jgi:hypothetical protein